MNKIILTVVFCIFLTITSSTSVSAKPKIPIYNTAYLQQKKINIENFAKYVVYVKENKKYVKRIVNVIFKYAKRYNIDPLTLMVIINTESHFDYRAKGKDGEIGLGQIMPTIWFDRKNHENLYDAGIIDEGKEHQLKWIGKNIQSTAHIFNAKRTECFKFHINGTLKKRGYRTITECSIRRYNGSRNTMDYYVKVTSNLGQYYYFVQTGTAKYFALR